MMKHYTKLFGTLTLAAALTLTTVSCTTNSDNQSQNTQAQQGEFETTGFKSTLDKEGAAQAFTDLFNTMHGTPTPAMEEYTPTVKKVFKDGTVLPDNANKIMKHIIKVAPGFNTMDTITVDGLEEWQMFAGYFLASTLSTAEHYIIEIPLDAVTVKGNTALINLNETTVTNEKTGDEYAYYQHDIQTKLVYIEDSWYYQYEDIIKDSDDETNSETKNSVGEDPDSEDEGGEAPKSE